MHLKKSLMTRGWMSFCGRWWVLCHRDSLTACEWRTTKGSLLVNLLCEFNRANLLSFIGEEWFTRFKVKKTYQWPLGISRSFVFQIPPTLCLWIPPGVPSKISENSIQNFPKSSFGNSPISSLKSSRVSSRIPSRFFWELLQVIFIESLQEFQDMGIPSKVGVMLDGTPGKKSYWTAGEIPKRSPR